MALRVLLADESSTIKKVIQLTLQDYAVEVKAVPVGLDVLPVARAFLPDIIFIDILLPKRSGYEVAQDLRKDPLTQKIPLVMMWSGFLQVDEAKLKASQVNRKLEKPFEPDELRKIIHDLAPKTASNPISAFLQFPDRPDFKEEIVSPPPTMELESNPEHADLHLDIEVDADEGFRQVPLHKTPEPSHATELSQENWQRQDLSQFKINLPQEESSNDFTKKYMIPEVDLNKAQVSVHGDFEEISFAPDLAPQAMANAAEGSASANAYALNQEQAEKILREEAKKVLEAVAWKILPDMVERIVREEINKLLQDTEKSI